MGLVRDNEKQLFPELRFFCNKESRNGGTSVEAAKTKEQSCRFYTAMKISKNL